MNVRGGKIIIAALFAVFIALNGCSVGSKSRALVVDCPNEKPAEINKSGLKNEMEREKTLDKINARRDKERK